MVIMILAVLPGFCRAEQVMGGSYLEYSQKTEITVFDDGRAIITTTTIYENTPTVEDLKQLFEKTAYSEEEIARRIVENHPEYTFSRIEFKTEEADSKLKTETTMEIVNFACPEKGAGMNRVAIIDTGSTLRGFTPTKFRIPIKGRVELSVTLPEDAIILEDQGEPKVLPLPQKIVLNGSEIEVKRDIEGNTISWVTHLDLAPGVAIDQGTLLRISRVHIEYQNPRILITERGKARARTPGYTLFSLVGFLLVVFLLYARRGRLHGGQA